MAGLAAVLRERYDLQGVAIHHRVGRVEIGEASVVIAVSAPHRRTRSPRARTRSTRSRRPCRSGRKRCTRAARSGSAAVRDASFRLQRDGERLSARGARPSMDARGLGGAVARGRGRVRPLAAARLRADPPGAGLALGRAPAVGADRVLRRAALEVQGRRLRRLQVQVRRHGALGLVSVAAYRPALELVVRGRARRAPLRPRDGARARGATPGPAGRARRCSSRSSAR